MLARGAAVVGAMSMAGAALACPEGPEAARLGVAVSYEDGTVSTYRRGVDGIVNEVTLFDSAAGDGYGVVAFHGLYLIEEFDLVGGEKDLAGLERQAFPQGLKTLPAPAPGLEWTGAGEVAFGADPAIPREVSLSIGQPERVAYGACTYDSWPALLRHRDASEDYSLGFDYLPALGIAVLRSFADADTPAESYVPVAIAAAP
jgi:hypothetical protein